LQRLGLAGRGTRGQCVEATLQRVASLRNVAHTIARTFGMDEFNTAVNQLNEVKTKALILCDAAY